jgi:pyrophosphate--fructose-6-phosphate 1-phosphotransferase
MDISALQKARYTYKPKLPASLLCPIADITVETGAPTESVADQDELKEIFKLTYGKPIVTLKSGKNKNAGKKLNVGVILSGGQAPGGHNVIAGLYDGIKNIHADSTLYGILNGPIGLIENKTMILSGDIIDAYRNTGGFDIIGSGRTKVETPEQFAASLETAKKLGLNAVVVIGGDDSNTNAALLAEYFLSKGSDIQVIGCPKTIDGDLKNEYIETSFGFDTACRIYSELIGNLMRDANSAKKYWHFVKLMGRSASHITLECALQTHPNVSLISEEIASIGYSLDQVVDIICDSIVKRANKGDNFGIVLIPEGLVEFIPEIKQLITELNEAIGREKEDFSRVSLHSDLISWFSSRITEQSLKILESMPQEIGMQFLMDRDPHGNVEVSKIETERLLIGMAHKSLQQLKADKLYKGKFSGLAHFFGYEGRCAFPTNFDTDYCYSLGYCAAVLIASGLTGYISSIRNLTSPAEQWVAGGIPLIMMMNIERRSGMKKPVIRKALVDLAGGPFREFCKMRETWAEETCFCVPGAIQYFGPPEVSDQPPVTLVLEQEK